MLKYIGRTSYIEDMKLENGRQYKATVINGNSFEIRVIVSDGSKLLSISYKNLPDLLKSWSLAENFEKQQKMTLQN